MNLCILHSPLDENLLIASGAYLYKRVTPPPPANGVYRCPCTLL